MLQQYSLHSCSIPAACNRTTCKDKLFRGKRGVLFVQKAFIFVKSNENDTKNEEKQMVGKAF